MPVLCTTFEYWTISIYTSEDCEQRDPGNGQSKSAVYRACSRSLASNNCLHISAYSRWVLEPTLFFVCFEGASTTALTVCDDFF